MGATSKFLLRSLVLLAVFVFSQSSISEMRFGACRSGNCSQGVCSSGSCSQGTCSSGTCGTQGVFCRNGACQSGTPFRQPQFVGSGSPQQIGAGYRQPSQPQGARALPQGPAPQQAAGAPAQGATSGATLVTAAHANNKEMRVINSEPVDITQFAKRAGKDLTRVMLNPNTPLYVKMRADDKSDGGLFWTFLVDPKTFAASGETTEGVREFNFNDPYERQSLEEVKKYLQGMQLDATLRGFLKRYWPSEGLPPETKAPETQVAESEPNPTAANSAGAPTHANPTPERQSAPQRQQQPEQQRPQQGEQQSPPQPHGPSEAAPKQTASQPPAREERGVAQARGVGPERRRPLLGKGGIFGRNRGLGFDLDLGDNAHDPDMICDGNVCRPRNPLKDGPAKPESDSAVKRPEGGSAGGRVIVRIYKKSPIRRVCRPCDDLYDRSGQIQGHDELTWWIGGKNLFPTTDVFVEKNGKVEFVKSIEGNMVGAINQAIAEARSKANQ